MGSPHMPKLTASLLRSYSEAALQNADELLVEASLLHEHGHDARAYFLAVACIEEAGKALMAFDGQNRNLSDPAVCTKLKSSMESHAQKINYVLSMWTTAHSDPRKALKKSLEVMVHLKQGREPSMYSDLRTGPDRVQTPREIVRATAARDCVRLARNALIYTQRHVKEKTPPQVSPAQNTIFTMKSSKFKDIVSSEEFLLYFISRMEEGESDFAEAVVDYERERKTGAVAKSAKRNHPSRPKP